MPEGQAQAAFEALFLAELPLLYASARRYARSAEDAEDLVQETMLKAFKSFDPADPPRFPRAWLQRVLRNEAIDSGRRSDRRPQGVSYDAEEGGLYERLQAGVETGQYSDPLRLIARWNDRDAVRVVFDDLPEHAREVLVLADVGGLRYAEIAEVLDIPEGTVMSRLSRARRAFERGFAEHLELPGGRPETSAAAAAVDAAALLERLAERWGGLPEPLALLRRDPVLLDLARDALARVADAAGLTPAHARDVAGGASGEEAPPLGGGAAGALRRYGAAVASGGLRGAEEQLVALADEGIDEGGLRAAAAVAAGAAHAAMLSGIGPARTGSAAA